MGFNFFMFFFVLFHVSRKWMIVTENGSFQTQRQHPKMALIRIALDANGFQLSAPNMKDIQVPFTPGKERITCRVWKLEVPGLLYGQEIGEWFSAYLEKANLSLVAFGDALLPEARKCEIFPAASKEGDAIMYSDASPFLVISESSLADLNGRLEKQLPIRNFRPNFFVAGCQGAYAEVSLGVSNWQVVMLHLILVTTSVCQNGSDFSGLSRTFTSFCRNYAR